MLTGTQRTLRIERLSLGGDGVARADGCAVFVPYAAPGDTVEVQITETHSRYARARLLQVVRPSPDRVSPPCPYHFQANSPDRGRTARMGNTRWCGGCSWQHLAYPVQLRIKQALVQETLERIGGLRRIDVLPVLGMEDPWRYRNKIQQPVGWDGRRLVSGFYAQGTHDIMPIEDCLVQPKTAVRIINRAKALLQEHGARAYDAARGTGWIRHLFVRVAAHPASGQDQALLVVITRTPEFPRESSFVETLRREFPELVGIHQNVNPASGNVVLGRTWRTLAGADALETRLGRLHFRLSPASFFQVNSVQAEALYDVVKRLAGEGPRLLDLYTGVGTIALWLADKFTEVGGVEEAPAAVRDAQANAERNGIENARFVAQRAEVFLRGMPRGSAPGLTLVLDPPRAGCAPGVVRALLALRPSTIVYVSCDPGTLARDAGMLAGGGYRLATVQPVDLFPHTPHIETVVQLTR